ncbi:hypothetical protein NON00_02355 [Roseomonas sp. GC11]|uniref:hypothetical protein n=1 Tax=Roseomonas sp. GC11 TaxID=2950546 RepID=UPI002108CE5B|nr:hypothetical protein [Roseomonas sp. GC11]MCQ4158769.1 hypothetical protein [Roseomonas sp. GC11]
MPKYKVTIIRLVKQVQSGSAEVEADNTEDAVDAFWEADLHWLTLKLCDSEKLDVEVEKVSE